MYSHENVIDLQYNIVYNCKSQSQSPWYYGEQTLTLIYGRLSRLHSLHLSSISSPPFFNLTPPPPPPSPHSILLSSLHPASQERRSHAADLLCAIWLTSCHPYPRREWLCRVCNWRTPLMLRTPAHLSRNGGKKKTDGEKTREREEEDKEYSGKEIRTENTAEEREGN